jgi:hypothetical protein
LDTSVALAVCVITELPPFPVTVNGYDPFATDRATALQAPHADAKTNAAVMTTLGGSV